MACVVIFFSPFRGLRPRLVIIPLSQLGSTRRGEFRFQTRHKSTALDRMCISLLEFVQDSPEKDNQTLACMYILIALTRVSESCAETYPWFLQS
jgi:hypothetical protein